MTAVDIDDVYLFNTTAYSGKGDARPIWGPGGQAVGLVVIGQLGCLLGVDRLNEQFRVSVALGDKSQGLAVGRPGGPIVPGRVLGDVTQVASLGVCCPDLTVAATLAGEGYATRLSWLGASGRPGWVPIAGWVVGQVD